MFSFSKCLLNLLCEIHSKPIKIVLSDLKTALSRARIFARKVGGGREPATHHPPTQQPTHPPTNPPHTTPHTPTMPDFAEGGESANPIFFGGWPNN